MSDETQRRLLWVLAIAIFVALDRPMRRFIAEQVPERRGPREDVVEAVLQGLARTAAVIVASALVRQLARGRR